MTDYFDNYFFTSNLTEYVCPGFGDFQCKPPNACARDPNTGKRYCCDYNDVCWTITATCASDGTTIDCGSGDTTWCCLDGTETCTQTSNQINICWNTAHDTLTNISSTQLNDTFSSLSSASPSASSFTFSPITLIAATQTTSSTTTTSSSTSATGTSSSSSSSSSATPTSSSNSAPSTGISGGAIAGIVIAVIAALVLVAAGVFFVLRKRRTSRPSRPLVEGEGYRDEAQKYSGRWNAEPIEMADPRTIAHELPPQGRSTYAVELPGNSHPSQRS